MLPRRHVPSPGTGEGWGEGGSADGPGWAWDPEAGGVRVPRERRLAGLRRPHPALSREREREGRRLLVRQPGGVGGPDLGVGPGAEHRVEAVGGHVARFHREAGVRRVQDVDAVEGDGDLRRLAERLGELDVDRLVAGTGAAVQVPVRPVAAAHLAGLDEGSAREGCCVVGHVVLPGWR